MPLKLLFLYAGVRSPKPDYLETGSAKWISETFASGTQSGFFYRLKRSRSGRIDGAAALLFNYLSLIMSKWAGSAWRIYIENAWRTHSISTSAYIEWRSRTHVGGKKWESPALTLSGVWHFIIFLFSFFFYFMENKKIEAKEKLVWNRRNKRVRKSVVLLQSRVAGEW